MRVTFDSQIFCLQQYGGISRYFASLAREMDRMDGMTAKIVAPLHVNEYLSELRDGIVSGRKINNRRIPKSFLCVVSAFAEAVLRYGLKPDVVHETYYYPQIRGPRRAPLVISVYDMNYERHPEFFPKGDPMPGWKRAAVERADHVICISENTRRDLIEFCGIAEERVSVTYLGYDPPASMLSRQTADGNCEIPRLSDKPYLLYVGSRTGCKNFRRLLDAVASSSWIRRDFNLVCFGGGAFTPDECAMIERLGLEKCVSQMSGKDSLLAVTYRDAVLFVYPSLYEGFGIPPLEAMSLDCPVVCSNASSIPEVVGDAAVMFDPSDTDDMRARLETVLNSGSLREDLVARGRLRRDLFSWQRCARETVAIYERILTA